MTCKAECLTIPSCVILSKDDIDNRQKSDYIDVQVCIHHDYIDSDDGEHINYDEWVDHSECPLTKWFSRHMSNFLLTKPHGSKYECINDELMSFLVCENKNELVMVFPTFQAKIEYDWFVEEAWEKWDAYDHWCWGIE
jgi:hypothetical protein